VGMMGRGHLNGFLRLPEAQVLAVCDVDRWRRDDAQRTVHQTYAASRPGSGDRTCDSYNDLRELLDREDIDAVVISTGDRWHALATVLAARAGKDIYCEKPASLTIDESLSMIAAVDRYGRIFQTGLQQRSTPEFVRACRLVQEGRIGRVQYVYVGHPGTCGHVNLPSESVPEGLDWDLWLGPAPWRPFNARFHPYGRPPHVVPWHFCRDFGGGNLTSNTVHAFDVVQWALQADESGPVHVSPPEAGEYPMLTYRYAGGELLHVDWRVDPAVHPLPPGWSPDTTIQPFGALFVGEDGWIHVGRQGFLQSHPAEIVARPPEGDTRTRLTNHHQDWLQCIRTRERPVCDAAVGCRSSIVSHLGCIAHWTGRSLHWDPVRAEFDDAHANLLRSRPMRQPWRL
jgi:predicted dehydrogenase